MQEIRSLFTIEQKFTTDFCSFVCHFLSIDIDDCHNHTCQNGASCVDGVNDYSCTCVIGFTGSSCKIGKW